MLKIFIILILVILSQVSWADKDIHDSTLSIKAGESTLKFSGYFDTYYAYDFARPYGTQKDIDNGGGRNYTSNPLYDNQLSVAYSFLQTDFEANDEVGFRFAYQYGDIVQKMYEGEAINVKPIREMTSRIKLSDKLLLEVGIMPSFFGFETFINKENMHATRAHMTDFAPDFDAGARLHYNLDETHHFKFQIANGWQVIRDNNRDKALGGAYVYSKKDKFMFNLGQFFGNEAPEGQHHSYRAYSNLFAKIFLGRFTFAPMLDLGWGEKYRQGAEDKYWAPWQSYGLSVRYAIGEKNAVAVRYDRTHDPNNIIPELKTTTPNGWQSHGYTLTFEHLYSKYMTYRIEGNFEKSKDPVYQSSNPNFKKSEQKFLYTSLSLAF